jgi:hypothetical protein
MHRSFRFAAITLLTSWFIAACSTTSVQSTAHTTPSPNSTVRNLSVCFGSIPSEWATALAATTVNLPQLHWFSTEAVDDGGNTAYGSYYEGKRYGVGAVNFTTRSFSAVSKEPSANWGGVIWMSFSKPWLVWAEGVPTPHGSWDLMAWNINTRELRKVSTSRLLAGQYTFPVVGPNYVAWSQATNNTSADIRIYRFSTHTTSILDSGRLSPPVFAGNGLVWSKFVGSDTEPTFQMVDAVTLTHQSLPAVLAQSGQVIYLAGSSEYLLWTETQGQMAAYDFTTGTLSNYQISRQDQGRHALEFPMLAGRILTWFTGVINAVGDLSTGKGFDVVNGAAAGSGSLLVVSGAKGNVPNLSALRLTPITDITSC